MKKLLIIAIVMLVASMANAALLLSVNGQIDPPDTSITLEPSKEVIIDIWGDGITAPGTFFVGLGVQGPGTLNSGGAVINYAGTDKGVSLYDDAGIAEYLGIQNPFTLVSLNDVPAPGTPKAPLTGTLVDNMIFHCEGIGDVVILLFDIDGNLLDTQVIHQIPEPVTVALLGLGALFIRRK